MTKINDLKRDNIQSVRACFYQRKTWTKNEISDVTDLSLAGTTNVLQYLVNEGEIFQSGKADSRVGRKSKEYSLLEDQCQIGTLVMRKEEKKVVFLSGLFDLGGNRIYENRMVSSEDVRRGFDSVVNDLLARSHKLQVLAVSIPGVCADGMIDICDIASFQNFPIRQYVQDKWNIPLIGENDANAACVGLAHRYPDVKNMVVIYQPEASCFGCGIMIDGKLYNGFTHMAGELRFFPFDDKEKDADKMLAERIQALISILNPQLIGYASDCLNGAQVMISGVPARYLPHIVEISDFVGMIESGLLAMGKHAVLIHHK